MDDCLFCKIIKGDIPSVKIWEDDKHIAILDAFPNTEGMTLVIPKKHYESYAFDMPEDVYSRFFLAAKKVIKLLEKGLGVQRVGLVMEGMGVNHAHIKLYPLHGLKGKFEEMLSEEDAYFDKYPGYLTTQMGPKKNSEELKEVGEKIRG